MNYLKRIGRLVAICICAVCVGIIPITAHAMEVSDIVAQLSRQKSEIFIMN